MLRLLLLKAVLAVPLSAVAMASQHSGNADDLQTPQRTVMAVTVEPTPGQILCQRQAKVLTRERFISALDPQIVDSWGVNWGIFLSPPLPFDDAQKRQNIRFIVNKMKTMPATKVDGLPRSLYLEILGLQGDAEGIHAERLDILALTYFGKVFPHANLTPETKLGGVQLGERIIVNQKGMPSLTYHVKTHSAGRLSSNSTAAKLVNPQELMAYSVLEHLGVGCEAHFFGRSPEDVYIATLDAGTGGSFCLFEVMSGHLGSGGDEAVGKRLAGSLINISPYSSQLNHTVIEQDISHDTVAQNFIRQMSYLDIITRTCRLCDLLNNPNNFGFFELKTQLPHIRIVDFRVIDDPLLRQENYDPFGGFLVGNGLYNYASSHKTMKYVLHSRPLEARVETARHIMQSGLLDALRKSVRLAHRDVSNYIHRDTFIKQTQEHGSSQHIQELEKQLQEYHDAIVHNIDFFNQKLMTWKPDAEVPPTDRKRPRTPDDHQVRENDHTGLPRIEKHQN